MRSIGVSRASKAHELFGQPADIRWRNELPWHSRVAPERLGSRIEDDLFINEPTVRGRDPEPSADSAYTALRGNSLARWARVGERSKIRSFSLLLLSRQRLSDRVRRHALRSRRFVRAGLKPGSTWLEQLREHLSQFFQIADLEVGHGLRRCFSVRLHEVCRLPSVLGASFRVQGRVICDVLASSIIWQVRGYSPTK